MSGLFIGASWGVAWILWAYPFDGVAFLAPSALTAGHFFSWKKVTKNRLLHHTALRCATGSLAPVLLREDRAVRPILGLSAFRPSMASTSLRKTCARPPEVAVDQEPDQDQQPGQRLANRCALALFIYQRICGVAGRATPCALHWQYRPLRGTSRIAAPPLLQGLRKF